MPLHTYIPGCTWFLPPPPPSLSPGVDYKVLMSREGDPLLQLFPVLFASNVHLVAQVAGHIPNGRGSGFLTQGMVLCTYALKLFWKRDKKSSKSTKVCGCVLCDRSSPSLFSYIDADLITPSYVLGSLSQQGNA